jgi:hypothetical protein
MIALDRNPPLASVRFRATNLDRRLSARGRFRQIGELVHSTPTRQLRVAGNGQLNSGTIRRSSAILCTAAVRASLPCLALIFIFSSSASWAQRFDFSLSGTDDAALARALPPLAKRVAAVYADPIQGRYLSNLFRLQMVAGDYSTASATLQKMRELAAARGASASTANLVPDAIMRCTHEHQQNAGTLP